MNVLQPIGRVFIAFLATSGRLTLFALSAVSHAFRPPFHSRTVLSQMVEIGTMRVTEQIDALTTLSTNPMKYLVADDNLHLSGKVYTP